jgi:hypothetical protein
MSNSTPAAPLSLEIHIEGKDSTVSGLLVDIGSGQIHLRCERWMEPGSNVSLRVNRIRLRATITYCRFKRDSYLACLELASGTAQQRSEPRFPLNIPGEMVLLGSAGAQVTQGVIKDISHSGLGLRIPVPVEISALICIDTGELLIVGEARHCAPADEGEYSIGVRLTDVFSDSPEAMPLGRDESGGTLKQVPGYASAKRLISALW